MRQKQSYRSDRRVDAEIQSGGVVLHVPQHVVVRAVVVAERVNAEVDSKSCCGESRLAVGNRSGGVSMKMTFLLFTTRRVFGFQMR